VSLVVVARLRARGPINGLQTDERYSEGSHTINSCKSEHGLGHDYTVATGSHLRLVFIDSAFTFCISYPGA